MATQIPTQAQYEARERQILAETLAGVNCAPLAERKENAAEFGAAMRDEPERVAERIEWVINGSYGWGAAEAAARIQAQSKRTNQAASITQLAAELEWRCPSEMARKEWHKLTGAQQEKLAELVGAALEATAAAVTL